MYLMDSFLGGQFSTYGMDVIRISGMEVSYFRFRKIAIPSVYLILKLSDKAINTVYPIFATPRYIDNSGLSYFLWKNL